MVTSSRIEFNPVMPKNRKVPRVGKYVLVSGSEVDGVGNSLELFRGESLVGETPKLRSGG